MSDMHMSDRPDLAIRDGSQICRYIRFEIYYDDRLGDNVLRALTLYPNDYFLEEHGLEAILAPLEAETVRECERRIAKELYEKIVANFKRRIVGRP